MSDDATTSQAAPIAAEPTAVRRCPWCSETLPDGTTDRCPHCNASLRADGEAHLPGLTEVEAPLASKARRLESPKRSKLLSWISGDIDDEPSSPLTRPSAPEALAPPARDVRREMLRLQLEAEGITVAPDGSIALPTDRDAGADAAPALAPAPASGPDADATHEAAAEPEEIRRAS